MNGNGRKKTRIAVLADNWVATRDVRGEHGLSFWIGTGDGGVLFDTGQGFVLADNARAMGVDLSAVRTVVLSHGHYDHTGGLAGVLRFAGGRVTVHAHPDVVRPKYQRSEAGVRDIGMTPECRDALLSPLATFAASRVPVEIVPGLSTTGEIPRRHPHEAVTDPFFKDAEGRERDDLPDDQAVFMDTPSGVVVLLGCAHAGLINTLDRVAELVAGRPICAVIGGLHLRAAAGDRVEWTLRELPRFGLRLLAPLHCTGQRALSSLWTAFPSSCRACGAGTVFEF